MSTIADETTIVEDRPTKHAAAEHPERTVRAQPTTPPGRTARRWIGGGVTIVAAAIASVLIVADEDTPAEIPDRTEVLDDSATQLDVHGIPIWWSQQGGAPRSENATELDVHGIPTWWSAGASVPRP